MNKIIKTLPFNTFVSVWRCRQENIFSSHWPFNKTIGVCIVTHVIFPKGWRTLIKSVSLQPSATARQWMTREGGVLWCAVELRANDCGIERLELEVKVEMDELGDNE